MERVRIAAVVKTKNLQFCLILLSNADTIHKHGFSCILSLVAGYVSEFQKQQRNESLRFMYKETPVQQKSRKFIRALNEIWKFGPPLPFIPQDKHYTQYN